MSNTRITQKEALAIAVKLNADIIPGAKHQKVHVRYKGSIVARYGVTRSSKEVVLRYVHNQLWISRQEAVELAQCSISERGYFELLRKNGKLPG